MPACHDLRIKNQLSLPRVAWLLLVFLLQSFAVLVAGFIALFVDFEPSWSAEGPQAALIRPADARAGSLLLKTEDGTTDATTLGIDVAVSRQPVSEVHPIRLHQ
jgi:Ca-activated chloride channel family protein